MPKNKLLCLILVVFLISPIIVGCGAKGLDLPDNILEIIPAGCNFESEKTKNVREQSAQAEEMIKDKLETQQWVFSYPGSVEEALAELDIPANAMVIEPYEVPITDIVYPVLVYGAEELEESLGSEWLEKAFSVAREWQEQHQLRAEVILHHESNREGSDTGALEKFPEQGYWSITIVSPTIDLEQLELIEETSITIMRLNYKF